MISATEFQPPAHPAFSLSTLWSRQLRDVDRTVWYSRSVLHGSEEKRSKNLCSTRAVGSSKAEFDENPKARVQCSQPAIARFAQASRRAVQLLHDAAEPSALEGETLRRRCAREDERWREHVGQRRRSGAGLGAGAACWRAFSHGCTSVVATDDCGDLHRYR